MDMPQISEEIVTRPADHEIFLTFRNDSDAELFTEWLEAVGFDAFRKWVKKQKRGDDDLD
jgi:hypothetical protein